MGDAVTDGSANPLFDEESWAMPLIEGAPLPMVEVEGPGHVVCFVNAAFCRLLGKTSRELVGQPFRGIARNADKCVPLLDRVYATGQLETHVEADPSETNPAHWLYAMWPSVVRDESPQRVVIQLTKVANFHENIAAVNEALLIAGLRQHELRDVAEKANMRSQEQIAERLRAETALREANEHLARAVGMAERANRSKDDFLAALSHELRTPLTPVLIAAATLREDPQLTPVVREQLGMIERNISLEARLIDDLLDLTRISHGKLQLRAEPCDAHGLIDLAIEIVHDDAVHKEVTIERVLNARHSRLVLDPARFQQVMWNLLRNAVKFTPRGGKVSVRTRDAETVGAQRWIQIEVTDTGVGIDAADLKQIFLPFNQGGRPGNQRFGGVGLGLAIARAVVVAHHGRIAVSSEGLNRGATFLVDLPGAADPPSKTPPADGSSSPGSHSPTPVAPKILPLRMLLVEDHANTRQALMRLLQRDGHQVTPAVSVVEGIAAAAAQTFDLVISDLGLPDGSGIDLMANLRDLHGLRGIALSGYGMAEDLVRSHEVGFVAHLVKPVSIAELRRVIAALPSA